jgi:hypothetical protein
MYLNNGSKNLFRALKELLRGGRPSQNFVNLLVAFVVMAIVLESFLLTTFFIVLLVVK